MTPDEPFPGQSPPPDPLAVLEQVIDDALLVRLPRQGFWGQAEAADRNRS